MNIIKPALLWLVITSALTASHAARAQNSAIPGIDNMAAKFIANKKHVGLSIGIIKNGVTYVYNYGIADKNTKASPGEHTVYEIASVTKTFTGIILAHVVLEQKIKLDDDIHQYLDSPLNNLYYHGVPVKIIHLANHTAGLPKFVPMLVNGFSPQQNMHRFNNITPQFFLHMLGQVKLDTMPGVRFSYSNAGPQLLQIILEKVYHQPYAELVKKYITAPMRMNETSCTMMNDSLQNAATGYNENGQPMPLLTWWRWLPAAGGIRSTITDMLQYLRLNLNETDTAIKLAHTPTFNIAAEGADSIGLYWFSKATAGGYRELYHAGGSFGCTSFCATCPARKTGVVILANDASAITESELKAMADKIFEGINSEGSVVILLQ